MILFKTIADIQSILDTDTEPKKYRHRYLDIDTFVSGNWLQRWNAVSIRGPWGRLMDVSVDLLYLFVINRL